MQVSVTDTKYNLVNQSLTKLLRYYKENENQPISIRLPIIKQIFEKTNNLLTCKLFNTLEISHVVREKCYEFMSPVTYSFVSPLVYKHFFNDNEIMTRTLKIRNYLRHKKSYVKKRKHVEIILLESTNLCYDVISLLCSYI